MTSGGDITTARLIRPAMGRLGPVVPARPAGAFESTPRTPTGRDERLDWLRGLCVLKMIAAHGPGRLVDTAGLFLGFVSAAEGFFFIGGFVLGHRAIGQTSSSDTL